MQPNGKYCIALIGGGFVAFNLTEQDIIDEAIKDAEVEAKESVRNAKHYGEIINKYIEMCKRGNPKPYEELLKSIGFDIPYDELVKCIPQKPIYCGYGDFTTFARCPTCGHMVQNCMGSAPKKCNCGQMLDWKDIR